jgi:RimJ/RimL family protein N-acetyltransferase
MIFKSYQRKGYALEAINAVKKKGSRAKVDENNIPSIKTFLKAGFRVAKKTKDETILEF